MFALFTDLFRSAQAKSQRYRVQYRVHVSNPTTTKFEGFLILPLAEGASSQKMLSPITALPKPAARSVEAQYNNRYAVWNLTLKPGAFSNVALVWDVEIAPVSARSTRAFVLSDYPGSAPTIVPGSHLIPADPRIIAMAQEAAGNETNIFKIVRRLQDRVERELNYGDPIPGLYSAAEALAKKTVDCGGFDALLVSLCLALKIPARIVSGFWAGQEKNRMHAWVEAILPDGTLFPLDPSVEFLRRAGRSKKRGGFGDLPADRIRLSVGSDLSLKLPDGGAHTADILQTPLVLPEGVVVVEHEFLTEKI